MSTTGGFQLPTLAENSAQKFQQYNNSIDQLDRALTARLAVSVASGNATVTLTQAQQNQVLAVSGAAVTGRTVSLPQVKRLLIVTLDSGSSESVSLVRGATTLGLAPGEALFVYLDGSADGLVAFGTGAITGAAAYVLAAASASTRGGITVGTGLKITGTDTLAIDTTVVATASALTALLTDTALLGAPTAPTPEAGADATRIATKEYVDAAVIAATESAVGDSLDGLGSTQGALLYRSATAWVTLTPGSIGQMLISGGSGANPSWADAIGYTLPAASATVLGGVTVAAASGLTVDGAGALAVDTASIATQAYVDTAVAGAGGGASTLDDLTDVVVSSPATAQGLYFNGTSWVNTAPAYDLALFIEGTQTNAEVLLRTRPRACTFPAGAAGSYGDAGTAATGSLTITAKKNGSAFATWVWSASGTVAAVTLSVATSFNGSTDILTIEGAATADATLADVGLYLAGARA